MLVGVEEKRGVSNAPPVVTKWRGAAKWIARDYLGWDYVHPTYPALMAVLPSLGWMALVWLVEIIFEIRIRRRLQAARLCFHCFYPLELATPKSIVCPECGFSRGARTVLRENFEAWHFFRMTFTVGECWPNGRNRNR